MNGLAEEPEKNHVTPGMNEKTREPLESTEERLRDLTHLEMAYEWLRNRQKPVQLKGVIENV